MGEDLRSSAAGLLVPVLALVLAGLGIVATAAEKAGLKSRVIAIGEGRISPRAGAVAKGTTVIWLNSANGNVNISFDKGKEVQAVCTAATHFTLEAEGKYQSGPIPRGATASLRFEGTGKYRYTVAGFERGTLTLGGQIIVK